MRRLAVGLALGLAGMALSACREVAEESTAGYEPSKLESIKGADVKQVTFTAEGANRAGLRTVAVRGAGNHKVVPYAALIYDADGKTYVYTSSKRLSYLREEVKVDRIDGDHVLLSAGPPVGTRIVTVGVFEAYGTELEIAGG
jgi:hypothetical protein